MSLLYEYIILKEAVGDTLEQLWISYNLIDKTKGIGVLRNLRVLYMSNNLIKEWSEFQKLQECTELKELSFMGKFRENYIFPF